MAATRISSRRRLVEAVEAVERIATGRANPAKRQWLLTLSRALLSRDGPATALDWPTKLRAARHGFLPSSYILYNLAANGRRDYVSDSERSRASNQTYSLTLNGEGTQLLRDKLAFHFMSKQLGIPTPDVIGVVKQGNLHMLGKRPGIVEWVDLQSLIDQRGCVIVKPVTGAHGRDIALLESMGGSYRLNGRESDWSSIERRLRDLEYFIVSEWVEQGAYSAAIFPHSTNAIRLLTLHRRAGGGAILAGAFHRFGRRSSAPVDNFSLGGLSVAVDLVNGTLSKGASFPHTGELTWHATHPDTGARIEGVRIPNWAEVRDGVLEAANRLSFLPYVGWDAIATPDGYTIIEGNSFPELRSLQVHGPLLVDPDVRSFFEEEGIVFPNRGSSAPEAFGF